MTLSLVTNHAAQGLEKRLEYIKKSVRFAGLLESYSNQIQELENAIYSIYIITIDNATGVTLDYEGEIVGELRLGRDDTTYRRAIKARIQINNSSGTTEDVLTALVNFLDRQYEITTYYPAAFEVRIVDALDADDDPTPTQFFALLQDVKAAGVYVYFHYSRADDDHTFQFSSGDTEEDGEFTGWSDDSATTGGEWSTMIGG